MTVTDDRTSRGGVVETEVLFPEARRRRRRRYGYAAIVVFLALSVSLGLLFSRGTSAPRQTKVRVPDPVVHHRLPPPVSLGVVPKQPGPLALGPNGDLYVADAALSEILERLPTGAFNVIAGDGKLGFSGDNGPATKAALDAPEGMAISSNGTIYFADSGNDRVRAISPDGTITTVAGNGQAPAVPSVIATNMPATDAAIGDVNAVTIGPGGSVYFTASDDVMEMDPNGTLSTFVSSDSTIGVDHSQFDGYCGPVALAFDGSGDLYMGCSNIYYMLERTATGQLVDRGILRPHDANAAISAGPGGSVIGLWQSSVQQFTTSQDLGVKDFLDPVPGVGDFWPQGVVVAPNGTMYFDQDGTGGIGPPAIIAYSPDGTTTRLWSAPKSPG
jgi:hypothetical protein